MKLLLSGRRSRIFLLFTFPVTWGCWWLLAYLTSSSLIDFESLAGTSLFIAGGSAPTIGAYLAVISTPEEGSLREFHRRVTAYRANWFMIAFAFLSPLVLGLTGQLAAAFLGFDISPGSMISAPLMFFPLFFSGLFFGGIEEFGWRGVLQETYKHPARLGLINLTIGLIWALWHLPLFYIVGTTHYQQSFLFYTIAAVGYSGLITRLYAQTRSILLCVILHASINASIGIRATIPMDEQVLFPYYALFVLAVGSICVLTYPQKK